MYILYINIYYMHFNSEILLSWKLCAYSHQNLFFFHKTPEDLAGHMTI